MATEYAARDFELKGTPADVAVEARPRARGNGGDGALARGLGWFSVGLGVAEVAAPGTDRAGDRRPGQRTTTEELLRAAGLREIASGIGILTRDRQAGWVWARVGGDVMDLALLGLGFNSSRGAAAPARLRHGRGSRGDRARPVVREQLGDVIAARDRCDYVLARQSPSTGRRSRSMRSGTTSRTCRASCATSSRSTRPAPQRCRTGWQGVRPEATWNGTPRSWTTVPTS